LPCFVVAWFWFCCFAFAVAFKARRRRNAVKRGLILLTYPEWEFSGFPYNESMGSIGNMESREGIKTITLVQVADLDLWNYAIVKMPTEGYHSA
jgi:hypothetical protein